MSSLRPHVPRLRPPSMPNGLPELERNRLRARVASRLFGGDAQPLRISRYTVLRRLGAGGLGIVYAAYDPKLDRKVALKLLRTPKHRDPNLSLRKEAQALAALSHPNVVTVYEVGEHQGQLYIAMEFLRGRGLDTLALDPGAPLSTQLVPWLQAARGLEAIHAQGLVHRDFKPSNAMQLLDGSIKLFDFGLAKRTYSARASASRRERPMGTPAYMAPEQRIGGKVDARADQFSFCAALWNFLCVAPPGSAPPDPSTKPKSMPSWLYQALSRGLSVEPKDRFPSMRSLIEVLDRGCRPKRGRYWRHGIVLGITALALAMAAFAGRPDPCQTVDLRWNRLAQEIQSDASTMPSPARRRLLDYIEFTRSHHHLSCQQSAEDPAVHAKRFAAQSPCYWATLEGVRDLYQQLSAAPDPQRSAKKWLSAPLPSIEACERRAPGPGALSAKDRNELEGALTSAQIQLSLRHYKQALALANDLLARLPAHGVDAMLAETQLIRARCMNVGAELNDAQLALDEAYRLAQGLDDDNLRFEAMVLRAKNFSAQGKPQRAQQLMLDAYPLAKRPGIGVDLRVEYFGRACRADRLVASPCQAIARCREGLELLENGPRAPIALNKLQRKLAWALFESGQPKTALKLARKAAHDLRAWIGDEATSILTLSSDALVFDLESESLRMQNATPQRWAGMIPSAQALLDRYHQAYGAQSPYASTMRNHFAEVLRRAGELDRARPHFEALVEQMSQQPERYYPLTKLGQILIAQGHKAQGVARLANAIEVIAANNQGAAHNAIPELGEAHFALARADAQRREHARQALSVYKQLDARAKAQAQECTDTRHPTDLYAQERQRIQAWLGARTTPSLLEVRR